MQGSKDKKETANDIWERFTDIFWVLFCFHIIGKAIAGNEPLLGIIGMSLISFAMIYAVGLASYKFSGKKSYWLFGILGFFWIGVIGIFVAYFTVKNLYKHNKIHN